MNCGTTVWCARSHTGHVSLSSVASQMRNTTNPPVRSSFGWTVLIICSRSSLNASAVSVIPIVSIRESSDAMASAFDSPAFTFLSHAETTPPAIATALLRSYSSRVVANRPDGSAPMMSSSRWKLSALTMRALLRLLAIARASPYSSALAAALLLPPLTALLATVLSVVTAWASWRSIQF